MRDVHALFPETAEQKVPVTIGSDCTEIGRLRPETLCVDSNVDRVPARKGLPIVIVIIDAVVTDTGYFHLLSSP